MDLYKSGAGPDTWPPHLLSATSGSPPQPFCSGPQEEV